MIKKNQTRWIKLKAHNKCFKVKNEQIQIASFHKRASRLKENKYTS